MPAIEVEIIPKVVLLLQKDIILNDVLSLTELDKCPACYGISLCEDFQSGRVELLGRHKFRIFTNFNLKNVYWGKLNNATIVLKKLAHDSELKYFDQILCEEAKKYEYNSKKCYPSSAARILTSHVRIDDLSTLKNFDKTDLLRCSSSLVLGRLRDKFQENSDVYFFTLLLLNPEPIILQTFTSENGWPFPRYLGACGRVIAEEYVGPSLSSFQNAPLQMRMNLALQVTHIAQSLTNTSVGLHLYMTDVSFHNFAVTTNGRVILVDTENIIIVDHEAITNNDFYQSDYDGNHLTFSVYDLCSHKIADHNFYVVCQGLLADTPWFDEVKGGLLHDLPNWIDERWQLRNLIAECVNPSVKYGRFTVFLSLQAALQNALSDF
uniref:FAM69 protein-kinase domain-containing protein n=1 Tax=Strigamia maritima TaxID=126957 RepID=T1IVG5_STRMM